MPLFLFLVLTAIDRSCAHTTTGKINRLLHCISGGVGVLFNGYFFIGMYRYILATAVKQLHFQSMLQFYRH